MTITNEQRDRKYETGSEIQKHLYASPESGNQLRQMAEKHQLTEDVTYTDFVIAVGDIVLGFYTSIQLPQLLSERLGMDPKKALSVTADVLDFLSPLTTGVKPTAPEVETPTQTITSTTTSTNTQEAADLADEIAKTEAALETTPKIRTMAEDMQQTKSNTATPIYSNTQESILREGKKEDSPRWGEI